MARFLTKIGTIENIKPVIPTKESRRQLISKLNNEVKASLLTLPFRGIQLGRFGYVNSLLKIDK